MKLMTFDDSLKSLFIEGLEKFKKIITDGYDSEKVKIPVIDPLQSIPKIAKEFQVSKGAVFNAGINLNVEMPQITGLQSVSLTTDPQFCYETGTLKFGLELDQLSLQSHSFSVDTRCKLLLFDKQWDYGSTLRLFADKVAFSFVFTFDPDLSSKIPLFSAEGSTCSFNGLILDCKRYRIVDILLPVFLPRIKKSLSQSLGKSFSILMTDNIQKIYLQQELFIDKLSRVYQMKIEQGGWSKGQVPRIFQGFGGVGELPLPTFWELPAVNVASLEHRSVDSIMESCKTGDIILFSGTAPSSQRIRRLTQCPFSHVVIVVKEPEFADGKALVWQSTASVHAGVLRDRESKSGIQLNLLDEMIRDYREEAPPGVTVVCRQLKRAGRDLAIEDKCRQTVIDYIRFMDGKPYTDDMDKLYLMGLLEVDDPHKENYFCAGQVAELLVRFRVLAPVFKQHQYAPRDFSDLQQGLPFVEETASFGEYIVVESEAI